MSDLPDFAGEQSSASADLQVQEPAAAPAAPAPQEAPAAPPAAPIAQPTPAAPEASAADQAAAQGVPLATFLDMRDRANAATKRAEELEQWRKQQEAKANAQPLPDRNTDPEAYEQYREQTFNERLQTQRVDVSMMLARQVHGPEVTEAAHKWGFERCDQDPLFNAKVMQQSDPIGFVIGEWKREQLLSKVEPSDFEAFQAWKAAQAGQQTPGATPQQAAPGTMPAARPAAPRASIAAAPSAGAHADPQPLGAERTFERMFGT